MAQPDKSAVTTKLHSDPAFLLPLEASTGSGDSGGPILVAVGRHWHVAGITAWKRGVIRGTEVFPGRYGETCYGVRLGNYADWIKTTMASDAVPVGSG